MKILIATFAVLILGVSQFGCADHCPALRFHVERFDGSALAPGTYRIKVTEPEDGFVEDHTCQIPSAMEDSSRCRVEGTSIDFVFDGQEYVDKERDYRLLVNGKTMIAGSLGAVRDPMPPLVPEGQCSTSYASIKF